MAVICLITNFTSQRFNMLKIVHSRILRKLLLTMLIVVSVSLSYAYDYDYNFFDGKAKFVKLYPNPATSFVNFEFSNTTDKSNSIEIFSFTGKKMYEQKLNGDNRITVTLSNDYYRGLYLYKLRDKSGNIIESGKFQVVK